MSFLGYAKYGKRVFRKRNADPHYIILFVTDVCNAHCGHCLLGQVISTTREMTVDEYDKTSRSMGDILFLLPTGGEPFLRDDLSEIVRIFCRNNDVRNVGIPTNGSLTTKVIDQVRVMLRENPGVDFAVDVSIDALGEEHDRLRAIPGLFDKCLWTLKELQKLEEEHRNFNANICTTMSSFNQDKAMEVTTVMREKHGVRNVNNLIARKGARAERALGVDAGTYEKWVNRLREETETDGLDGYHDYPGSDVINAMKNVRQDMITRIVKGEKGYQVPCYAANLSGVIYAGGDVYPCEILEEPLGNLRETDYDFRKIWFSERTEEVRRMIRETKCYCTFECFMTNNILFTPRMLPKVAAEYGRLKVRRALSKRKGRPPSANGSPA
ncbi:MAG: radical SAM protein [Candidatus Eisenbacteria bacterium]